MRRLTLLIVCLIIGISLVPGIHNPLSVFATPRTLYVGEDASNAGPCTSSGPCTLAGAVAAAHGGDTIELQAGTYDDPGNQKVTNLMGLAGNPVTITADSGVLFAYDSSSDSCPSPGGAAAGPLLKITDSSYVTLTGLVLDGGNGTLGLSCTLKPNSAAPAALYITGTTSFSNIIIENSTIKHVYGTCLYDDHPSSSYITVETSTISDCADDGNSETFADGIDLKSSGAATVSNNTITRVSGDGVFIDSGSGQPESMTYNTVYNAGYAGLRTNDTGVTFDHNTIWNSGQEGIKASQSDSITYNDIVSTTASSGGVSSGSVNPESAIRFVGAGSGETITHNDVYYGSDSMYSATPAPTPLPGVTPTVAVTSVAIRQDSLTPTTAGNTIACNILVGLPQGVGRPLYDYDETPLDPNMLAPVPGQTVIANDWVQSTEPTSTVEVISTAVDPAFVNEPSNMALATTPTSLLTGKCPDGSDIGSGH